MEINIRFTVAEGAPDSEGIAAFELLIESGEALRQLREVARRIKAGQESCGGDADDPDWHLS